MTEINHEQAKVCVSKLFQDLEGLKNTLLESEFLNLTIFQFGLSYEKILSNLSYIQKYFSVPENKENTNKTGILQNTKG